MAKFHIGGQAVIEGVLIRAPERYSTAVRRTSGEIVVKSRDYIPLSKRKKIYNLPLVRGVIGLVEMLSIGIKSLNFSADMQVTEEEAKKKKVGKSRSFGQSLSFALSFILVLGIALLVFFYFPLWLANFLKLQKTTWQFNVLTGVVRISLFLGYVWFLSFFKDLRRIFQYHGAEHMSIYAFESGEGLTLNNIRKYSTLHPRCGTSFIFLVLLLAITIYSISDFLFYLVDGSAPGLAERVFMHLILLPFVAGVAYEALKLSDKTKSRLLTKIIIAPGLWLQMITTQKPSDDQIEVAVAAIQGALRLPLAPGVVALE
ncbi:MAG: hypothetical protein A2Z27_02950 [candidate division Zixibacteria bacterium RBG_16_50_21]|nr:MAG: hypothetical protein A2Z27_02950 [candidate division Zixibacteria bacterium RBG_16_50_21]